MPRQRRDSDETQEPQESNAPEQPTASSGLDVLAQAILQGNQALVDQLKASQDARSRHDEKIITRLGKFKENPEGSPKRSVFNLRGQRDFPLPMLKCDVFFCPHPVKKDPEISGLTREELELVNLLEPGMYTITLNDQSTAPLEIQMKKNASTGAIEQMRVVTPAFDHEMFRWMPPLAKWLREVLAQHAGDIPERADAVLSMVQEKRKIAAGEIAVAV